MSLSFAATGGVAGTGLSLWALLGVVSLLALAAYLMVAALPPGRIAALRAGLIVGWLLHAGAIVIDITGLGSSRAGRAVRVRACAVRHVVAGAGGLPRGEQVPRARCVAPHAGADRCRLRCCLRGCSRARSTRAAFRDGRRFTGCSGSRRTASSERRCCMPRCSTGPIVR